MFNFLGQILVSTCLIPFLFTLPRVIGPSDAFLQICLHKLNGNIFQIFAIIFLWCAILTCLWKNVHKTSSLKVFFQPKKFTTYNKFQCSNHGIDIRTFIFNQSNEFFPWTTFIQQICQIFNEGLSYSFFCLKQANSHILWLLVTPQKIYD